MIIWKPVECLSFTWSVHFYPIRYRDRTHDPVSLIRSYSLKKIKKDRYKYIYIEEHTRKGVRQYCRITDRLHHQPACGEIAASGLLMHCFQLECTHARLYCRFDLSGTETSWSNLVKKNHVYKDQYLLNNQTVKQATKCTNQLNYFYGRITLNRVCGYSFMTRQNAIKPETIKQNRVFGLHV